MLPGKLHKVGTDSNAVLLDSDGCALGGKDERPVSENGTAP